MGSVKHLRLYPAASKRKTIPQTEIADGPIIGRSPGGVTKYRAGLKKAPPLRQGQDY